MINQKEHVHRKGKNPELCLIIQHESKKNCAKQQSCDQDPSSTPILSLGIEAANVTHVYTLAVNLHLVLNRNKLNKNELKRQKQKKVELFGYVVESVRVIVTTPHYLPHANGKGLIQGCAILFRFFRRLFFLFNLCPRSFVNKIGATVF